MKRVSLLIIVSMLAVSITGCVNPVSPNSYDVCEAGVASQVLHGTIVSKRKVSIDARGGAGGLAGAAAGAVGGSAIGGGDRAHILGAIGGAVLGGLVGNAIDKKVNTFPAYEYIIKLKSGNSISVAQAQELEFQVNQPVMVIYGPRTRIVPDNGMSQYAEHRPSHRQVNQQMNNHI